MYMRGCGSRQYSTLTRAHIHLNLWVLPGPVHRPINTGFHPIHCEYFFAGTHNDNQVTLLPQLFILTTYMVGPIPMIVDLSKATKRLSLYCH